MIAWFVAMFVGFLTCGVGMALFPLLFIGEVVLAITAGQAASRGEWYRYPFSIRMVSSGLERR